MTDVTTSALLSAAQHSCRETVRLAWLDELGHARMATFGCVLTAYERVFEFCCFFFFQAEDGIRDVAVTGVQTCALPISGLVVQPRQHPWRLCVILLGERRNKKMEPTAPLAGHIESRGSEWGYMQREQNEIGRASCRERV